MFIPINKVALLLYFNVLYFTARFLKFVWPFFNILHERAKSNKNLSYNLKQAVFF